MSSKIVVFLNSDKQVEKARAMAPHGLELQIFTTRDDEARAVLTDAEYMVCTVPPFDMDDDFYKSCPKLKLVQLLLAGYDKYDLEAARRAGVTIATNGGANSSGVAEHAIMLMLALRRHLLRYHSDVIDGRWWKIGAMPQITDLNGSTLGIVGFNTIGRRVARLAQAFGMSVIYYDVARLPSHEEEDLNVTFRLTQELLRESDVISLHVPLLPSTKHMISTAQFELMKPNAILINTSRGPVVDEDALYEALANRRIAGAGLDVLTKEPPDNDNPLFDLDNVVLTPHQAGHIAHYFEPALRAAFFNIQRVYGGIPPISVVPELRDVATSPDSRLNAKG